MVRAIETIYHDYRFRSRVEARWAVFLDALGIEYEYEKEGYDLDGVWYLPDFWLPQLKVWLEIKGEYPTDEERLKLRLLNRETGFPAVLLYGEPGRNHGVAEYGVSAYRGAVYTSNDQVQWYVCNACGKVYLTLRRANDERVLNLIEDCEKIDYCSCRLEYQWTIHPRLINAISKSKQARFEHGENG